MPKVVAPIQSATMEDLGDSIQETVKKAHRVLDAAAVAKTLEGLGIGSNSSSEIRQISEAFSGLATGMKSIGDLQSSLVSQIGQMMGNGNKTNLTDLIGLILMMRMLEPKEEKKEDVSPVVKELIDHLREEIKELKESRGPSPVDQQFQSLTTQILGQHIATLSDPFASLAKIAEAKDKLKSILGEGNNNLPPEYSEGALRLRALEKEEKAMEIEREKHFAELNHSEKIWSQHIPTALSQAGAVIASVLGSHNLMPTRPLQFDPDAVATAENAVNS